MLYETIADMLSGRPFSPQMVMPTYDTTKRVAIVRRYIIQPLLPLRG